MKYLVTRKRKVNMTSSVTQPLNRAAVELARSRADIIITTGGLGPTCDDLTKQVLAEAFGRPLVFHPECADAIRDYFAKSGREMTENNLQQAWLPEGCHILDNPWLSRASQGAAFSRNMGMHSRGGPGSITTSLFPLWKAQPGAVPQGLSRMWQPSGSQAC